MTQSVHSGIQFAGGRRETIGIDVGIRLRLGLEIIYGHIDGHDVLERHRQFHALLGIQQSLLQSLGAHQGGGDGERLMHRHQILLHLSPEGADLPDCIQKLLHQLIPLILQQLVAALGGTQLAFQAGEFHTGGAYRDIRHWLSPPYSWSFFGQYFSISSGLIRFSSLLGRMLSSSQPRSKVSSMERFSS